MDTVELNQIESIRKAMKRFAGRNPRAMLQLKKELREFEIAVMNDNTMMIDICKSGVDYWFHELATS